MNNIYLIGMPGSGKTSIGVALSKNLNVEFIDTDRYITQKERHVISDIFKNRGEAYFREIETKCLKEISEKEKALVSTGGGIILNEQNITIMKNTGKIIFINTPPHLILNNSSLKNRPLLSEDKNKIYDLYETRYEKYVSCADFVVDNTVSFKDLTEKVYNLIKNIW